MAVDDHMVQEILENKILIHLFPKQKVVDVNKLICFRNLIGQRNHVLYAPNYVHTSDFVLRTINRVSGTSHMIWILYILYSFDS